MKAENVWKHMAWKMSGLMYVSAIFSTSSCSACTRSADKHSHSANQICYTTTLCHSFQKDVMLFHYLSNEKYGDLVAVLFVFSDNWQLPSLKIVLCKWASLQINLQGIRCDPSFNIILKVCFARIRSMYNIVCRMLIISSVDLQCQYWNVWGWKESKIPWSVRQWQIISCDMKQTKTLDYIHYIHCSI